jgi:hypothetical protein
MARIDLAPEVTIEFDPSSVDKDLPGEQMLRLIVRDKTATIQLVDLKGNTSTWTAADFTSLGTGVIIGKFTKVVATGTSATHVKAQYYGHP